MKKCVVFSYGPVPSPDQNKVEGGGLRCWGLAKGLREQFGNDIDITIAYNETYKNEQFVDEFEGIHLTTWNITSIGEIIQEFDTVIVSYCMGDLSVEVATQVSASQQLVLDCYVPAYIEISARQSEDLNGEYAAFANEVGRWAQVLRRGDLFLCANANQKRFYQGVLAALGRVNPATYADDMILIVPYGVYRELPVAASKPIDALIKTTDGKSLKKGVKKLLWFGGIYPWFDIKTLLRAVEDANKKLPVKLIIVGAKNPFNGHPDFVKSYDDMITFINDNKSIKENIILQDWVEFDDRADWYLNSDLVILINKIGEENELAWRTRLVDYIWADLPILTNAGDPLGDELVVAKAAIKLNGLTVGDLSNAIVETLSDEKVLSQARKNVSRVRETYYWDKVVTSLGAGIIAGSRPTDITTFGLLDIIGRTSTQAPSKLKRIVRKARKLPGYYKKYGFRNTYFNIRGMVVRRTSRLLGKQSPKILFVAHQLDSTGAPHVFIDMIAQFRKNYPNLPVDFHTYNPAVSDNIKQLNKLGLKPKIYVASDIEINYSVGDTIVLNTVAYAENVRNALYEGLEAGLIKKIIWYIHEDEPKFIFRPEELKRIKTLLDQDKLEIFVLAKETQKNYIEALGNAKNIELESYSLSFPDNWYRVRQSSDFNELHFILPGMMGDTRKGQLPLAYAFMEFKRRYYDNNKKDYRKFSLTFVGVGDDFPSRQLLKHTKKGLGDNFTAVPPSSHKKTLELIRESNITLCYSLRESLPLYVYEGMSTGHPILRNDSSGMEEQLKEGVNGYYLDSNDLEQVIETIEKVCNKTKTTNAKLAAMSNESVKMTKAVADNNYKAIVHAIHQSYTK